MSSAVKRMSTMSATLLYSESEEDSDTVSCSKSSPNLNPTPNPSPLQQQSFSPLNNTTVRPPTGANSVNSGNNRKYEQLGMVSGGSSVAAAQAAEAVSGSGIGRLSPIGPTNFPPSIILTRDNSNDLRNQPLSPTSPSTSRAPGRVIAKKQHEPVFNPHLANLPKVKPEVVMPEDKDKFKMEKFALDHVSEQSRGLIFKHKIPLEEVLKFQRDPLRTPLMENLPKDLHREALRSFRLVQRIMSDTSPGPPYVGSVKEVQALLNIGVTSKFMRDEIYVQVCKQVRCNPLAESTFRGWLLLCVMAITFPPSKEFEHYMKTFTVEHYEGVPLSSWGTIIPPPNWSKDTKTRENEAIAVLAKFCNKKLIRICRVGARGKTLNIQEIERSQEAPFRASLFGEMLEEIMAVQARENPKDSAGRQLALPRILLFLTDAILSLNGCATEGIFRVPGDIDLVNDLRIRLERGKYDMKGISDPHVPSSLLKLWLRELAEPLIPANLYDDCIDIGREAMVVDSEEDVGGLAYDVLGELPDINHRVALYMLKFLKVIAEKKNQTLTRMTHANIALVFAPNFLRCPSDDPMVIFENTKYEQSFIRVLLTHDTI
ncbi:UNVERIFIED_CONTAM: hypothetical protein HDU68_001953 [Siphonaria sp. JEL0065]|nr:hypothetical protein HDU68_001953 [Siphonaria sp. JEL0065]